MDENKVQIAKLEDKNSLILDRLSLFSKYLLEMMYPHTSFEIVVIETARYLRADPQFLKEELSFDKLDRLQKLDIIGPDGKFKIYNLEGEPKEYDIKLEQIPKKHGGIITTAIAMPMLISVFSVLYSLTNLGAKSINMSSVGITFIITIYFIGASVLVPKKSTLFNSWGLVSLVLIATSIAIAFWQ